MKNKKEDESFDTPSNFSRLNYYQFKSDNEVHFVIAIVEFLQTVQLLGYKPNS